MPEPLFCKNREVNCNNCNKKENMTKVTEDTFKKALEGSFGVQAVIAETLKVERSTITRFLQNNPEMKVLFDQERENVIDVAENRLFTAADEGKKWAIELILKRLGRSRGYVERQEVEQVGVMPDQKLELVMVNSPEDLSKFKATEKPMEEKKILIVDIETTNFLQRGGLIVEVGIVELDLNTGEAKIVYDELVKEEGLDGTHGDAWIFNNSDLKFIDCMKAKPLDKERIQLILDKYPATAYNKKFDFDFLRSRELEVKELECPMVLATDVCKIPNVNKAGFKWPSVQEAWAIIVKEDYTEAHRGADDALHEARIVYELYKMEVFKC